MCAIFYDPYVPSKMAQDKSNALQPTNFLVYFGLEKSTVNIIFSARSSHMHGVQRRMISVDNFFVFLGLLFFALLLLYVT